MRTSGRFKATIKYARLSSVLLIMEINPLKTAGTTTRATMATMGDVFVVLPSGSG